MRDSASSGGAHHHDVMTDPLLLEPTWFIDSDSPEVQSFVGSALSGLSRADKIAVAVALFEAVRDGLRYDPYLISRDPVDYRASTIAGTSSNWCVPKAVLLTAAARHVGIPARLGFADVVNHLTSDKLEARMGTNVFHWHGYSELLLGDRWFKLSTAFNSELCERFGVKALDFDGTDDALMHAFDAQGRRHMEYVNERGSYRDLPLEKIFADFAKFSATGEGSDDAAFAPES